MVISEVLGHSLILTFKASVFLTRDLYNWQEIFLKLVPHLLPRWSTEKRCKLVTGILLFFSQFIMLVCLCPTMPISYLYLQSGLVFGILKLSGFVTATIFSLVGHKFNSRTMAFLGSSTQGISVLVFGMIEYTEDKVVFLTLSYTLRYEFSLEINEGKLSTYKLFQ